MIRYVKGNIFDSSCKALVCPVNCKGVMGAGLAKQFKEQYPDMFTAYKKGCNKGWLQPGGVHVWWGDMDRIEKGEKYIINLATKDHWKNSSTLEWVKEGLTNLSDCMERYGINSVAIPPLGCGLGGLNWSDVKPLIEAEFKDLDFDVEVYEPV